MDNSSDYKDTVANSILKIGIPTLMVVGTIGNTLAFIVYSKRFFAKTSCGFYLRVLAITDTITIFGFLEIFLSHTFNIDLYVLSGFYCKLGWYITYAVPASSAWIESLVCFDRMINIAFKFSSLQKKKNTYIFIFLVLVYNILLYSPILYFYQHVDAVVFTMNATTDKANYTYTYSENSEVDASCMMTNNQYAYALSWYDLVNSTLAPFTIMLSCTTITLYKIHQTRKNVGLNSSLAGLSLRERRKSREMKKREQRDLQFAFTSIALCLIFFLLNIGLTVFNLLSAYNMVPLEDIFLFLSITLFIFAADYAIKFFIYMMVNRHFFHEFVNIFKNGFNTSLVATSLHNSTTK